MHFACVLFLKRNYLLFKAKTFQWKFRKMLPFFEFHDLQLVWFRVLLPTMKQNMFQLLQKTPFRVSHYQIVDNVMER